MSGMSRPSNLDLCRDFRRLLTEGFRIEGDLSCSDLMNDEQQRDEVLRVTKAWRNDLWKAFREIEDRLDPIGAMDRQRQKETGK